MKIQNWYLFLTLMSIFVFITFIIVREFYNIIKCKKCGSIKGEKQISFGLIREYKCKKCGHIRIEEGVDW